MNILHIFHWSYWFSIPAPAIGGVRITLIVIPLIGILAGIILKILKKVDKDTILKKVYSRFGSVALFFGCLLGLWVFFRQENTPIFSVRFWPLLIIVTTLWWVYRIVSYLTKRVPEIRKQNAERMEKEKYLPKKS